eukprot:GDKI01020804.1.p1 GENE.GDKI01020804.1~~GDKI01020804.1.p1  ORF type:complete len:245 (-),score=70.91 GDKI01020804.1:46-780(-)
MSVEVPESKRPQREKKLMVVKLPPTLKFVEGAFNEQAERERERMRDEEEIEREKDCVRWRFKLDAAGNIMRNQETGEPLREPNTHLVKWQDGSYTLFVGNTPYECTLTDENSHLFEEFDDTKVLHAVVPQRMVVRPTGTASAKAGGAGAAGGVRSRTFRTRGERTTLLTTVAEVRAIEKRELEEMKDMKVTKKHRDRQVEALGRQKGMTARDLEESSASEGSDGGSSSGGERKRRRKRSASDSD